MPPCRFSVLEPGTFNIHANRKIVSSSIFVFCETGVNFDNEKLENDLIQLVCIAHFMWYVHMICMHVQFLSSVLASLVLAKLVEAWLRSVAT